MLKIRDVLWPRCFVQVGDGRRTFAWFDNWLDGIKLWDRLLPRQICDAGFELRSKVCDLICMDEWQWPLSWIGGIIPFNVSVPNGSVPDKICWKNDRGKMVDFSTAEAWKVICRVGNEAEWWDTVWHKYRIPKHAFILWLVFRDRMVTQDWFVKWNGDSFDYRCVFCYDTCDSRDHLFFECDFPRKVWMEFCDDVGATGVGYKWQEVSRYFVAKRRRFSSKMCIMRIGLAAVVYNIWRERNGRLHEGVRRSFKDVYKDVFHDIRGKLLDPRLREIVIPACFASKWRLPVEDFLNGNGADTSINGKNGDG